MIFYWGNASKKPVCCRRPDRSETGTIVPFCHPQSCRYAVLRQLPSMGGWRFCAFKGKVSWATTILFVRMFTFDKITGGLLIMKSTYLLPWFKMTTWYFRLSRLLEVSNVKKRTKNHSAVADRIFMLVKNHVLAVSGMGDEAPPSHGGRNGGCDAL